MHKSTDLDIEVMRLASNLPAGTVVMVGKTPLGALKLHTVLRGVEEVETKLLNEAEEVVSIFRSNR